MPVPAGRSVVPQFLEGTLPVKTQELAYQAGKVRAVGYLAWDETRKDPRPGVVVFPEAFGLNDHARERTERLARLGYVALAADLIGDGTVYTDMAQLKPVIGGLYADRPEWRARARAALDILLSQSRVDRSRLAAIGFCFGGSTAIELARTGAPLSAITTFHAGLPAGLPEDEGRIRAKVLVCHGDKDPVVTKDAVDTFMGELRRDKVDWQFIHYGIASHSFTDPSADQRNAPAFAYSKLAEDRSWAAMRHLFEEAFA
jgi:dienelactone hydrolase